MRQASTERRKVPPLRARISMVRLSRADLRHRMLTFSAFLSFNLFYVFAGRSNILLLSADAVQAIDSLILTVSLYWLVRTLLRRSKPTQQRSVKQLAFKASPQSLGQPAFARELSQAG